MSLSVRRMMADLLCKDSVLMYVAKLMMPLIILFGFYIQVGGEYGPGGGFQAGIIVTSGLIMYSLVFGPASVLRRVTIKLLEFLGILGVLIYACVGFVTMLLGGSFLDYSVLSAGSLGYKVGIFSVEVGVGLSIFAASSLIYFSILLFVKHFRRRN